jgi:hypothetical protein
MKFTIALWIVVVEDFKQSLVVTEPFEWAILTHDGVAGAEDVKSRSPLPGTDTSSWSNSFIASSAVVSDIAIAILL